MVLYFAALLVFFIGAVWFIIYTIIRVGVYFFGAPYVPSSDNRTKTLIKLLNPKPDEKIMDLGSGDGKLLFEVAKHGAIAYGVEIDPILVWRTRRKIKKLGLDKQVFVTRGNLFKTDVKKYDAIVVYGITHLMPRFEKKLLKELKPGTRVISNYFKFPNWKPIKKEGEVLTYIKD